MSRAFLPELPLFTALEIKRTLRKVRNDQPTIYEQGDNSQKEASQQEVIGVVIGRIADELGISLDETVQQFNGPTLHVEVDGKMIAEHVSTVDVRQLFREQQEKERERRILLDMAYRNCEE